MGVVPGFGNSEAGSSTWQEISGKDTKEIGFFPMARSATGCYSMMRISQYTPTGWNGEDSNNTLISTNNAPLRGGMTIGYF